MKRITPISEMWSKARLIFFTDVTGELHDATGDVVSTDKSSITLGNRVDGKEIRILRTQIQHQEVLEE